MEGHMAHLAVSLLGPPQATYDGQPLAGFESAKVWALFAYLLVEADRPQPREALAALLWPEQPDAVARHNLRQALANLRQVLDGRTHEPPFLRITRASVQFDAAACELDFATFTARLRAAERHPHRDADACAPCASWLRRLLELDPLDEDAHRALMRVLAGSGARTAALQQYARCCRVLREELGVEPDEETVALYHAIRDGTLEAPRPEDHAIHARLPRSNLPAPPTALIGREAEVAALCALLQREGVRLVTLTGAPGIGKTRLAYEAAGTQREEFEDGIYVVDLAPLRDPELVAPTIARVLDIPEDAGTPIMARLLAALRDRLLPLAIELAAARSKLLAPEELMRRLAHPLALLTGGAHDLDARQRTLRATLDWSYQLLDCDEQRLFARLGVFAGGWTLEAAEAACGDGAREDEPGQAGASLSPKSRSPI